MKQVLTIAMIFLAVTVFGQAFEGTIIYQNSYISKLPNVTDQQLTTMMGSVQTYIIKGGNYKSSTNGTVFLWQLYVNKDNKLYNKLSNSETILWNDGGTNGDSVLNVQINKDATVVLGYKCDEVILTCKSGIQKYYFNSKLGVDVSLFSKHQFGNWYTYLKAAKALPLKSTMDNAQFSLTSTATDIKKMNLEDNEFNLPENAKVAKSPF